MPLKLVPGAELADGSPLNNAGSMRPTANNEGEEVFPAE